MKRRKIHTDLKILVAMNALPVEYKKTIHRSQLKRYGNTDAGEFYGNELSVVVGREIEWIKRFGDFPTAKNISISILKLFVFFRSVAAKTKGFNKALHKEREFFVELAQRFKNFISIKCFSKLIGIDETTLREWIRQVRVKCSDSLINHCRKVHSIQLLVPEIRKMKSLLTCEEFKFWPLRSVYFYALNNKIVSMGLSTWYKYAAILNTERLKPKSVKQLKKGIRASKPNELWHADVTYFSIDKLRFYIYTVIDNFSRFPLSVEVHTKLCGKFRAQTFKNSLRKALGIDPSLENLKLMTDGGPENFNVNVTEFIQNIDGVEIKHIKALSDGWPSNSMAEALNRVLKTFYLNNMDIRTLTGLIEKLNFAIQDFAFERPHGILKGLTPYQVYT
ncbi:MAG: DDE-type integrase/transposase/recombinase, partial [Bacteroidia bacterium]|nr:DDE-type integrase/transposase/recombinase [Bacteroidia bacterium]